MKLKIYIIAGIVLGAMANLASCDMNYDPLDTYSDVTEGVKDESGSKQEFQNKADVEPAMTGLHELMRNRLEHWYLDLLMISETNSDNAYGGTTETPVIAFENHSADGSSPVLERDWTSYLSDVAQANRIICNIDAVSDANFTTAERASIKAQAQIFRALVWFDMVRIWGNIPVITTIAPDITAENIEEVYDDYFPKQSSAEVAYKQIEADLLDALNYAPDNNPADKTRFSKSVARAMLAKVYAEKPLRDYDKVIHYCDQLQTDGFGLADSYSDLFGMNQSVTDLKMRNTREGILEAQFPSSGGNWVVGMFGRDLLNYDNSFTWAKWVTPSRDLINLFTQEGDTERFNESIVYYECSWSNYYPANHYPFMYKCRAGVSSLIKLRYADVLLLKAEAYLKGNTKNTKAAADIIDEIRVRAGLDKLPATVRNNENALWDAYMKERRLELAFEGQRWFDLCRWENVEEVMTNLQDAGRHTTLKPFTEDSYILAIPQTAIDQNENLVQNRGY